ncbi:hypothetical protein HZB93_02315 [Candidatus Falkowbacteria bacterium]|nr:hypothetical protein [Candidatus Falkowbacteria bacterium]
MPEKPEGGTPPQERKEGHGRVEELEGVVPPEDLRSAEELVDETDEALVKIKEKQRRRFIDEETQLPKVGGNFGSELKAAVMARRTGFKNYDEGRADTPSSAYSDEQKKEYYNERVLKYWHEADKHIDTIGKMIADALQKGKSGYDFRTALPYYIGHVGGVEIVFWPQAGAPSRRPYPTEHFKQTIEQFLPEDSKWMSHSIVSSVIEHLFPQEKKKRTS